MIRNKMAKSLPIYLDQKKILNLRLNKLLRNITQTLLTHNQHHIKTNQNFASPKIPVE